MKRFHHTSRFSFRIREQVPDFLRCFDRQLLILFRGRCLEESRGDITKMDTKFVQLRMREVTNDETSFQVSVVHL